MESGVLPALAFRFCASVVRQKETLVCLALLQRSSEVGFVAKTRRLETLRP